MIGLIMGQVFPIFFFFLHACCGLSIRHCEFQLVAVGYFGFSWILSFVLKVPEKYVVLSGPPFVICWVGLEQGSYTSVLRRDLLACAPRAP